MTCKRASAGSGSSGEGHAEELEQTLRLLVGLRRRHDADLQPAETVHLVVLDLREGELLTEAEGEIAAPIERAARDAPKVADPGQGEGRQPIQEVPHPIAAEGDLRADRVAGPDPELGDRPARLRAERLLAGDHRQVAGCRIDRLGVRERLAQADVDDDLGDARNLHRVAVVELLLERRDDFRPVALVEPAGHAIVSCGSPQWRQTRIRRPFSRVAWAIRVGRSHFEQTSMTLPSGRGWVMSRMSPCWIFGIRSVELDVWRGFVCRLAMFRPSTTTATPPPVAPRRYMLR